MKIQTKLILSFLALSLPFLIATNIIFYISEKNTLSHNILNHLESVASIQQHRVHDITEQNHERLKLVASRTQLRISLDKFVDGGGKQHQQKMNRILAHAQASLAAFKQIHVYSPDGVIVASSDPSRIGEEHLNESFFVNGREKNRVDMFYLDADQKLALYLAGPLYLGNKFLGVILIDTKVDNIVSAISDYTGLEQSGETILAFKNQANDTVFIMPTRFDQQAALRLIINKDNKQIPINRAFSGKGELLTDVTDYRNKAVLAATRYIKGVKWGLVVKIDKAEAFAPLKTMNIQLFSLLFCAISFIIFLSIYLAKNITRPIVRLTRVANNIAEDSFDEQADESQRNEIGALATAFNKMTDKLIKERARQEKNFKELQAILDNSSTIIYLKDTEGKYILINRQYEQLFNISKKDIIGKTDYDVFPKAIADVFLANDQKALKSTTPFQLEEEVPQADGLHSYISVKFGLFDNSGKPYAVCGISTDMSDWTNMHTQLQQSKEEWENTFNAMTDAVTIQDKYMRIVRANKAAYEIFHVAPGELDGKYCYEVFRKNNQPCPNCPEILTFKDGETHSANIKHEEIGKIFHVTSSPIMAENGEFTHIVHIAKDITEHKKMEAELSQAYKMEAIGTLAGGIAHDFNNILSAIIGFSELAKDDIPADSKAIKDIDQVIKSSRRAADLVQQILTFSRKSDHRLEVISPYPIIKEALKMLRSSLPVSIGIQEDIDNECGNIMADPTSIHQIIVNLCTNSLHAMENEKGILRVSLQRKEVNAEEIMGESGVSPGPFIVIEVADTGHGMDQANIERIFDPYYTTKEVGKGTGLGLAVIHGIIKDYHGFIRVKSELGQGTTFYVHIPALQQEILTKNETKTAEFLPTGTERILVVDDESMIVNMNKTVLERLGYEVSATTESLDALEKIRNNPDQFDLVITDQTMPSLTGAELAQKILNIKQTMPIVLCTGYSSIFSKEDALAIGIKKYARKPVNRTMLAQIVRQALDEN